MTAEESDAMTLAEQLVGTWILASSHDVAADGTRTETWGPNPLGTCMFDADGRFAQIVMRADLPKVARRDLTTPEQGRSVAVGSLAMYGTYAVDEAAQTLIVRFSGCTFASFNGTEGRRSVTMLGPDELKFTNAGRSGGTSGESVWRRAT